MSDHRQDVTLDEPLEDDRVPVRVTSERNRSRWRRIAAGGVGGVLLALGIRRRSIGGAAMALAGGWLVYRGLKWGNGTSAAMGRDRAEPAGTRRSVTVGKPADELYERWRDPETLSRVFGDVVEVTSPGEDRLRWGVSGPLGRRVSWDTRIVEDRPGEYLRWASVEGAVVASEGSVRFRPAPGDRGAEVTLQLRFDPPGGVLGEVVAERLGIVSNTLANRAVRRFKSLVEAGEIPTLAGNPSARGRGDLV